MGMPGFPTQDQRGVRVPSWSTTWTPVPTTPMALVLSRPAGVVPGTAEGERAVRILGRPIWWALPVKDVGRARDAGMVQTIGNGKGWTQSSSGVPGTAESGDRMGASLAGSPATGATKPLIGIPGEDSSTGAVLVGLPIGGGSVSYLKGTRIGDRFGFAVAP